MTGMLTRYNKKSVTVISEAGQRWNVSPRLLRRADDVRNADVRPNVIRLREQ